MTIATSLFYDRARDAMTTLTAKADALNTQISTGKKNAAPSDDPLTYARLRGIKAAGADADAYAGNLKIAGSVLSSADTTLTSMTAQLTRASELAVQANNGTLSATDRSAIGEELSGIAETLQSLAGTRDERGQPLFGGADGGAAVTQTGSGYAFASGSVPAIPIADGQSVEPSVTAAKLFALGGTDTLSVISNLATLLKSGADLGTGVSTAIDQLRTASDQVTTAQASLGARAARVELEQTSQTAAATERETLRSGLEDTDVTAAITELQKTMTTLQATQASFSKLSALSLFDYLK